MDGNGLLRSVTLGKIIALQHARYGVMRGEFDQFGGFERVHPCAVKRNGCSILVQYFKNLRLVCFCVFQHFGFGEGFSYRGFARWIADHAGKIANQENNVMPQSLKLFHFLNQHGMPQMKIGGGRIKSRFDHKGGLGLIGGF